MRNYVIINGVNSLTINGLAINELPAISKPPMRVYQEEIDGRDGDITTNLGYGAYDKMMTIGLYDGYDIDEIIAFFNKEGTVTFSNEDDKYYNYKIIEQIDYEKLLKFKTATITLHCQPFKHPIEETPIEVAYQYVEGEGESITLENTAEAQMTLDLLGNTQQDSTTGKNKLNLIDKAQTTDSRGITYKVENNVFTLNGTNTSTSSYSLVSWTNTSTANYYNNLFSSNIGSSITISANNNISGLYFQMNYFKSGASSQSELLSYSLNDTSKTITIPNDFDRVGNIFLGVYGTATTINGSFSMQLEQGSSATSFEPYTNGASPNPDHPQPIHTCSGDNTIKVEGKNLFDVENLSSQYAYVSSTGEIVNSTQNRLYDFINAKPNTQYTLSTKDTNYGLTIVEYDTSKTFIKRTTANNVSSNTITTSATTEYVRLFFNQNNSSTVTTDYVISQEPQLEKGSTATTYEPYTSQSYLISLGDIELNKIGTYQDKIYKDNGKWYLHKEIGKVVLNGSESWEDRPNFNDCDRFVLNTTTIPQQVYSPLSNYFKCTGGSSSTIGVLRVNTGTQIIINFSVKGTTSLADFKNWLSTHNTIVYYTYTTPTNTEITDSTLLEALENIYSMTGTTNISQDNNDLPFTINATALMLGSGEATINNIGNVYSKPTLDIVGNGVVNVSLNGNQIFSVNVLDEIVIDSTNLEAYNPTTHELMNRQVTGNIANLKLDHGENTLTISGDLDIATITNYVRWL